MSKEIRVYRSDEAPGTPQEGDLMYQVATSRWNQYVGSAWGTVRFLAINGQALTVTDATIDSLTVTAGYASTNSTTPVFYIPTVTGTPTGAIASLGGRAPVVYNTTGRAICIRQAGSWFTAASMVLA